MPKSDVSQGLPAPNLCLSCASRAAIFDLLSDVRANQVVPAAFFVFFTVFPGAEGVAGLLLPTAGLESNHLRTSCW